eukprot:5743251-Amphidinium_carterae.1
MRSDIETHVEHSSLNVEEAEHARSFVGSITQDLASNDRACFGKKKLSLAVGTKRAVSLCGCSRQLFNSFPDDGRHDVKMVLWLSFWHT